MKKENSITINGVKHTLIEDTETAVFCSGCSLHELCPSYENWGEGMLCADIFDSPNSHFEVLNYKDTYYETENY